ncbi:MAG: sugar phosphate nucleotidyltransferase [Patescibacteria group bacterium]
MKALILAGGRGKRINNQEGSSNKCLLPCMGKPLIQYSLENAVEAGVESIVIVVGYRAEDIINKFGTTFLGLKILYVIQDERKGLVHAMVCAREMINGSDFMLFLGDEVIVSSHHDKMLQFFRNEKLFVACGTVRVKDLSQITKTYALIEDEKTKNIFRLIEKPRIPINNIMGTGNCVMRSDIFNYIERTPINNERNEKELPDLIQCAIDEGRIIKHFNIGDGYFNINTPEDIVLAEKYIKQIKK